MASHNCPSDNRRSDNKNRLPSPRRWLATGPHRGARPALRYIKPPRIFCSNIWNLNFYFFFFLIFIFSGSLEMFGVSLAHLLAISGF